MHLHPISQWLEKVKVVSTNRKAGFEYFLLERFEAGLTLRRKRDQIYTRRTDQLV